MVEIRFGLPEMGLGREGFRWPVIRRKTFALILLGVMGEDGLTHTRFVRPC
jgi:hypothetical protein